MRLLLDESLPRRLAHLFAGHEVLTVADAGWSGLTNGRLLDLAQHGFHCHVTVDRSLVHQQVLAKFAIAVLVLRARTNRLEDLAPLIPLALKRLNTLQPGQAAIIDYRDSVSTLRIT